MISGKVNFTMLIGLPGCGKSYYADGYRRNPNVKVFSSDDIREEVYGDASVQDAPNKIFDIMKQRTLEALDAGYDVVYDATNVIRKYRTELLKSLPEYVYKIATVCWAPLEVCIERDASRERTVGKSVIDKMLRRWETPYYDEGWDAIYFHNTAIWNPSEYRKKFLDEMDIPQDNPHHTLSVLNHCTKACDIFDRVFVTTKGFQPPYYVRDAVTFHDIGKPYCKTFVNKKGETTEVAHFYDHEHVGAYFVLGMFSGLSESKTIFASWLVCNHMSPFINQKYYNSLPSYLKEWITLLHEADKLAH